MIKLVSIYHHPIPSAGFGGADFCCVNVDREAAFSLVCFQSQKRRDQMQKRVAASGTRVGILRENQQRRGPFSVPFRCPSENTGFRFKPLVLTDAEKETNMRRPV